MNVYFDTSALIKLVINERGTDRASLLWRRAESRNATVLVHPEGRAAIAAARRDGRIAASAERRACRSLDDLVSKMRLFAVDGLLAEQAAQLATKYGLRGYDAVHLAAAGAMGDTTLLFASWDNRLQQAAHRHGLSVAPRDTSS